MHLRKPHSLLRRNTPCSPLLLTLSHQPPRSLKSTRVPSVYEVPSAYESSAMWTSDYSMNTGVPTATLAPSNMDTDMITSEDQLSFPLYPENSSLHGTPPYPTWSSNGADELFPVPQPALPLISLFEFPSPPKCLGLDEQDAFMSLGPMTSEDWAVWNSLLQDVSSGF